MNNPVDFFMVTSPAFDAVVAAHHPSPECGGPCATCAFRPGTHANSADFTVALARLCVEGLEPFNCHEKPQACRGWIAAVNLNGAPQTEDDRHRIEAARWGVGILSACIAAAKRDQDAADSPVSDPVPMNR
jgi:hypothetical protein